MAVGVKVTSFYQHFFQLLDVEEQSGLTAQLNLWCESAYFCTMYGFWSAWKSLVTIYLRVFQVLSPESYFSFLSTANTIRLAI